ncbi:MAG: dethiobiotin synthase [Planctomycetota bacterium]
MHSFFITGTDTGVGKTYITAQLCTMFRKSGFDVGVMKPVSTGGQDDVKCLLKHTGLKDPLDLVNPIHFRQPVAPTIAAKSEGKTINIRRIFSAYKKLKTIHKDGILIEGVGGALVPLNKGYLVVDLIKDFQVPAIIITRPTLGTVNHTLLTIEALKARKIPISGFIVNYNLPGNKPKSRLEKLTARESPMIIEQVSGVGEINIAFIRERLKHIKCAGPKACPDS